MNREPKRPGRNAPDFEREIDFALRTMSTLHAIAENPILGFMLVAMYPLPESMDN